MPTKRIIKTVFVCVCISLSPIHFAKAQSLGCDLSSKFRAHSLSHDEVARQLGWVPAPDLRCGGYYYEPPFLEPNTKLNDDYVQITSNEGLFSLHGTSISQGKVTITYKGQQIVANKVYLYRDHSTGKLSAVDFISDVTLREPNDLVMANCGHLDITTQSKYLSGILYRTTVYNNPAVKPLHFLNEQLEQEREVIHLSAWGRAAQFVQDQPKIFKFQQATFSTCPPTKMVWHVSADKVDLNKNTGRGTAKNAFLFIKSVPVFYTPYLNFPIDARRQTGFLFPTMGVYGKRGPFLSTPFYWNLAPNYDTTITPTYMAKRGLQIADNTRYLTPTSYGSLYWAILPHDNAFANFKSAQAQNQANQATPSDQGNLNRLENASTTRKSLSWQHTSHFNSYWSGDVDYNWVSDDYYLRDLNSNNLDEVTQNQLLQQAQANFKSPHWYFLGRLQQYQTLHPIDSPTIFLNQYSRLPQLVLNANYPSERTGLNFFSNDEFTHFNIRTTPGVTTKFPVGNRINVQPGVSYPYILPYFYFIPRLQLALTKYEIGQVPNEMPKAPGRSLPIFDVNMGLNFDRSITLANRSFKQTLEPEVYYTYIPYRNQSDLPVFDTTENMLTYDQLFTYNRFSGIDRIGDANQVALGLTSRFIEDRTGFEKIKIGVGQIFYFRNRLVVLPTDQIDNRENTKPRSPIAGLVRYYFNPHWSARLDSIWDYNSARFNNQTFTLQYKPDDLRVINLSYSFVRDGDQLAHDPPGSPSSSLSQSDLSFAWPVTRDWSAIGRWTQNWNHHRFQNLLYGLQYDSCCWAVRAVAGKTFNSLNANNTAIYDKEFFIQFALKGLGNFGSGDPTSFLTSSVSGYQSNFGQDF